jgi:hypothetical protein
MSRAADWVSTCARTGPVFALQASAQAAAAFSLAASPASVSGYQAESCASLSLSSRQTTGVDFPTPRGSNPTTSYALSTSEPNRLGTESMKSRPDAPGPPGFVSRAPTRVPVAGCTLSARSMSPDDASCHETGALMVAQRKPSPHVDHATFWP